MSQVPVDDVSRLERLQKGRRVRRVGWALAGLGLLGCLVLIGYAVWRYVDLRAQRPPAAIVVIGESELEDGTRVAGLVAVVEDEEGAVKVSGVDTAETADIPGTSFDRLRDALSVGDADLVATIVTGEEKDAEWLLLDEDGWAAVFDQAGGVNVRVPEETTVFTGQRLFRFKAGDAQLDGDQAAALVRGSEGFSGPDGNALRKELSKQLGEAVVEEAVVQELLRSKGNEVSDRVRVEAFLAQIRSDR